MGYFLMGGGQVLRYCIPSSRLTACLHRSQREAATDPWPTRIRKGTSMQIKQRTFVVSFVVAAVVLIGAGGQCQRGGRVVRPRRADDQSGRSRRGDQEPRRAVEKDVKQVKLSVDGADVESRRSSCTGTIADDTLTDLGVLKAGGSTTPKDAPGRKGRLTAVTVEYKIVGMPRRP